VMRRLSRRRAASVLAAALLVPLAVQGQVRPDAGRTLEGIRPPPPPPPVEPAAVLPQQEKRPAMSGSDSKRIFVRHWRITGSRLYTEDQLEPLIHEFRGQKLTIDELNDVAARITAYYRRQGYLLSRAYIPAQDVRDNTVEIAVIEGHLAEILVTNESPVAGSLITRYMEYLRSTGPVEGHSLERSLLLLSDLPGVEVRSTLMPGISVGTSDLDLHVRSTGRVNGSVDAGNTGNRYTGEYRGGATLNINSPFHYGDLLTFRANTGGAGMSYGYGSWQTPLGGSGLKVGIAGSELKYRLRGQFSSLEAHGNANVLTARAAYPLIRSEYNNLLIQGSYDNKRLNDRIDTAAVDSHKTVGVWTLGVSGNQTDEFGGGGFNTYSLGIVSGQLKLDAAAAAIDAGTGGHHTQGRYEKLVVSGSRTQRLTDEVFLYSALTGQWSTRNLDTSETLSLGGPSGVRAYPQDEGAGDDAALLTVELSWRVPDLPAAQTIAFADVGAVRLNHSPLPTDTNNRRLLAGEGFGVRWRGANTFTLDAYLAWRSGPQPLSDVDRRPRAWVQFVQYF